MIRDGENTLYTDEDRGNLVIRLHAPEEIKENREKFSSKAWKRRIIIILIFLLFLFFTTRASGDEKWFLLMGITMLIAFFGICAEFKTIHGAKMARSQHYVELRIKEKLGIEEYYHRNADDSFTEYFYPVKAVDTTSGYECIYYLSQDEYDASEPGQLLKVNVLLKDLEKRKKKSSFNLLMFAGAIFMLASGMMIPDAIYSVINESEKLLYSALAAFVIAFFMLGMGIFSWGIKEMKKGKDK